MQTLFKRPAGSELCGLACPLILRAVDDLLAVDEQRTGARLSVSAVARRLGMAPATLRTWDRRYGIGPSDHASGTYRRYTADDLARLEAVRRLVLTGVAPSEAARCVLTGGYAGSSGAAQFPDRQGALPQRVPGGRVLASPGADQAVRGLARAAMALDSDEVLRLLAQELAEHGVVHTWEHLLVPVLVAAGERWAAAGEGVEVEHLLSDCTVTALRRHAPHLPVGRARPLLLVCVPGDQHSLPLHALAGALGERRQSCRLLGAALPREALLAAVRRTGPAALFVWSQLPQSGAVELLESMPLTRPPTAVVVGGPGWGPELPERCSRAEDLGAALDLIGRALGGEALASPG